MSPQTFQVKGKDGCIIELRFKKIRKLLIVNCIKTKGLSFISDIEEFMKCNQIELPVKEYGIMEVTYKCSTEEFKKIMKKINS